jgi:hypothetical protein
VTDLNNALAKVIAQVESGGFPYAMRFESGLFGNPDRWATPAILGAAQKANHCNLTTARMIAYTSYGLFQIMGFNCYGMLGLTIPVATFLWDTEQQLAAFTAFCQHNGVNPATFDFSDEAALEHFARAYNGPGDIPNYVQKMKAAYAALPTT